MTLSEALGSRAMAPTTVNGIDELKGLIGQQFGPSEWREITQEMINSFAELSGDDQWIHVDVERAKTESPFGTTVAHGNLTLSVIDGFRGDLLVSEGFKLGVNYGWNKVRFPPRCRPDQRSALRSRRSRSTTSAAAGGRSCSIGPSRWRAPRSPAASPTQSAARSSEPPTSGARKARSASSIVRYSSTRTIFSSRTSTAYVSKTSISTPLPAPCSNAVHGTITHGPRAMKSPNTTVSSNRSFHGSAIEATRLLSPSIPR